MSSCFQILYLNLNMYTFYMKYFSKSLWTYNQNNMSGLNFFLHQNLSSNSIFHALKKIANLFQIKLKVLQVKGIVIVDSKIWLLKIVLGYICCDTYKDKFLFLQQFGSFGHISSSEIVRSSGSSIFRILRNLLTVFFL